MPEVGAWAQARPAGGSEAQRFPHALRLLHALHRARGVVQYQMPKRKGRCLGRCGWVAYRGIVFLRTARG